MRRIVIGRVATLAAAIGSLPILLLLVGCADDEVQPVDRDGGEPAREGGTLRVERCGYDVSTRPGSSAPVPGEPRFGADPTPRLLHLGLQGDPRTTMVIQWRTVDETTLASTVQFGVGAGLDQTLEGLTFTYQTGVDTTIRVHEAHLCGLEPDTAYRYRVGGADAQHWSPTYSFRTAPDPALDPDAEVTLAFTGDSRNGFDVWGEIVGVMQAHAPDVILFSGDAVSTGAVQAEWEAFFAAAEPLLATTPLIAAHGNHEGNAINYYAQVVLPGDEEQFGLDYGPLHLTVVNDSPGDDAEIEGEIRDFLQADLEASRDAPWNLMMHHRPLWSASTRHGSNTRLQAAWGPIIDAAELDLVLSGHDHDYERSKPMRGSAAQDSTADGTVYLVAGGAGASLYENGTDTFTAYSEKTHSTVVLELRPGTLEATALREDGSTIETFSLVNAP